MSILWMRVGRGRSDLLTSVFSVEVEEDMFLREVSLVNGVLLLLDLN